MPDTTPKIAPPDDGPGSGGGGGGGGGDAWKSSPWFAFWQKLGFSADTAEKATKAYIANGTSDQGASMFHLIRTSAEYKSIFPNIDNLTSAQGWDYSNYANSPEANYFNWKTNVKNYAQQYGFNLTQADYANYAYRGWGQQDVNSFFGGEQWVKTNMGDLQYALGNFGDQGKLSQKQLEQLAEYQAGLGNKQGANLNDMFTKAMARAQNVFTGVTATLGQNFGYNDPLQNPDIGA